MIIPPALLNFNGDAMGISINCSPNLVDMPTQRVNYDDWHNNIKAIGYK